MNAVRRLARNEKVSIARENNPCGQSNIVNKYTYLRGGPWVLGFSSILFIIAIVTTVVSTAGARGHRICFAEMHRLGLGSVVDGGASNSGAVNGIAELLAEVGAVGLPKA